MMTDKVSKDGSRTGEGRRRGGAEDGSRYFHSQKKETL